MNILDSITDLIGKLRIALMNAPGSRANSIAIMKLDECELWNARAVQEAKDHASGKQAREYFSSK